MSAGRLRVAIVALVITVAWPHGAAAQGQSPEELLRRGTQLLGTGETERGVEVLREAVIGLGQAGSSPTRRDAELQLAAASWSLGLYDSATVHFQEAVRLDPTLRLDAERFSPELVRAFDVAKRTTPAVGLRLPADTTLTAVRDALPVTVTLTQPGTVTLRLSGPGAEARDTVLLSGRFAADSEVRLNIRDEKGQPLMPGRYRLMAEYSGANVQGLRATEQVDVTRSGADTLDHYPLPADSLFRPETRKGEGQRSSIWRGLAFGVAAASIPLLVGSSELNEGQGGGALVGLAIVGAGVAGYYLGRPNLEIPENVAYNRDLRAAVQARNRDIVQKNDSLRAQTRLRFRPVPGL